jgi:predicted transcriptional regulator
MEKIKEFGTLEPPTLPKLEDKEILAAIQAGLEDVKAGRVFTAEEARTELSRRITALSTPKER